MSMSGRRVIAAAIATACGGASAVVTNVLTDRWGMVWWVAFGVLLVVGVGAQLLVTAPADAVASTAASGDGSVIVMHDNAGTISTTVHGIRARDDGQ